MEKQLVDTLISLEPVFKSAGQMALLMRGKAQVREKLGTGIAEVDIVTESDLAVQEMILSEMAKTSLRGCRLMAEEKTPSMALFSGLSDFVLTLDPLDATHSYASGGSFFSVIVGLHTPEKIFYTFIYYPMGEWGVQIANGEVCEFGDRPVAPLRPAQFDLQKTIIYTYGDPETLAPDLFGRLTAEGYRFVSRKDISDDAGSVTVFGLGQVGGYYIGNPLVYDGLPTLHLAEAAGMKFFKRLEMNEILLGPKGPYYPGYYLVLR